MGGLFKSGLWYLRRFEILMNTPKAFAFGVSSNWAEISERLRRKFKLGRNLRFTGGHEGFDAIEIFLAPVEVVEVALLCIFAFAGKC